MVQPIDHPLVIQNFPLNDQYEETTKFKIDTDEEDQPLENGKIYHLITFW